ncbi:hypothetical protein [Geodermatophilus sp. SYSU D00710]
MKAGVLHGLGNLLPGVTGIITAPLTARALGVQDRGVSSVLITAFALFSVAAAAGLGWGAREATIRHPGAAPVWVRRAWWVSLVSAVPAALLTFWLARGLALERTEVVALIVLLGFASTSAVRSVQANVLLSRGAIAAVGLANIVMALATTAALVAFFFAERLTVATVVALNALGLVAQWSVLQVALRRDSRSERVLASGGPAGFKAPDADVRTYFLTGVAQTLDALSSRLDILLVAIVASSRSVGLYSVAAVLPQVGYFLFLTLVQRSFAVSPSLSIETRSRHLFIACTGVAVVYAVVGGALAALAIVPIFGQEFEEARSYLWPAMAMTVGLAALAPTLLRWQRGGRSVVSSLSALLVVGALAAFVGTAMGDWWSVTVLGIGLIALGLVDHVRQWGWSDVLRGHRQAWRVVVRGVS